MGENRCKIASVTGNYLFFFFSNNGAQYGSQEKVKFSVVGELKACVAIPVICVKKYMNSSVYELEAIYYVVPFGGKITGPPCRPQQNTP